VLKLMLRLVRVVLGAYCHGGGAVGLAGGRCLGVVDAAVAVAVAFVSVPAMSDGGRQVHRICSCRQLPLRIRSMRALV